MTEGILNRLQNGMRPTELLRELRRLHGDVRNAELALFFLEELHSECSATNKINEYERIDSFEIIHPIWHWKDSRAREGGHTDDEIDKIIIKALKGSELLID